MPKAVILAAGKGVRLQSVTHDLPKPMLDLGGKPMLRHIVERMRTAGFDEFLVVVGYRHELIEEHLAGESGMGFVRQDPVDGTGSAALLARDFAGNDAFLLIFGDILAEPEDLRGLYEKLNDSADAVLAVKWVEDPYQGAAVYEQEGRVTRIEEKPAHGTSSTHWNSAGAYAFRTVIFDALASIERSPRGEYELTSALEVLLRRGATMLIHPLRGEWRDVGRPEDIEIARRIAGEGA